LFFLPPQDGFTPFLLSVIKKQSEYDWTFTKEGSKYTCSS
jgi:hypothetical protein